jgi:hypothetical protein
MELIAAKSEFDAAMDFTGIRHVEISAPHAIVRICFSGLASESSSKIENVVDGMEN